MTQLRQNPLDFGVLNELRQHCEATQSYAVWAEALEHHARAAGDADGDPIELGRLHYELGNLYRDQLGRSDRALEHYRTAIDLDAAQRPAISAARAISSDAGNWVDVAELLAREIDSLPEGLKRAAALAELGRLQDQRLGRGGEAEGTMRDAVLSAPEDLSLQHELATMLLTHAERSKGRRALEQREEAAEVLSLMARSVSDDYALAYLESALDAVPDHEESLELLEEVAPRMKRSEVLAPRWLQAIRATKDRKLARALRLKMASAYLAVGQLHDVRICLEPLLAEGDAEAQALARRATRSQAPKREEHEEELLSSELLLEGEEHDDSEKEDELDAADLASLEDEEQDDDRDQLANELSDLRAQLEADDAEIAQAADPLADLAVLGKPAEQGPVGGLSELLDSGELEQADAEFDSDEGVDSREELLDSGELSTVPDSSERELREHGQRGEPARPTKASQHKRSELLRDELLGDEHEPDPFAEETQPRAAPLTLAELTALTQDDSGGSRRERNIIMAPAGEFEGRDPDSEVTTLTPAEDPAVTELRTLRTELTKRLRYRDRRGAAEVAQTLLERGVFDDAAIEALEEHYRLARDFRGLRDLSMRLAHEPSFPADVRSTRLREAVMLSESKLGDTDGAAAALRDLLALEPKDAEAFEKLKKLLKRGQLWDDLADLFAQREGEVTEPRARAELLRELGALQREKRGAVAKAIDAYARARTLDGGNADDEVALSELYAGAGRYGEAAEMYEARAARVEPSQRAPFLATLANLYEERLHDDERAQHALEAWRAIEPRKPEPLHALIRVLERRGEYAALVAALTDQLALSSPLDRVRLHVRIAEVALARLDDAQRAADSYAEAIALAPQDAALWRAAAPAFERAGRVSELDEQLWALAQGGRDRALSSSLFEHLAHTRALRADLQGAILAREAQYAVTQEVPVLSALVALLRNAERPADLARRLDELARRSDAEAARALRLERADVLAQQLNDPEAAKAELERLLSELGPDDASALRKLVDLCVATGDVKRRASAQERLVKLAPSLSKRVELATELVDIYEVELHDPAGAARVLGTWTTLEPQNPTPYVRLAPLLAQAGRKRELLETLDKLTTLANSDDEAGEFLLRAARVAIEIEDFDGAWNRLVPRVVDKDDAAAERLLRELTRLAGRGEQLAALYVGLAQRSDDGEIEKRRWADAARVFEQELAAHDRALEAMLRALAKQLDNRELLGEVERLAGRAQAWTRLSQVYDTIVRRAESTDVRIQLLMRHARLLETRASDVETAFERVWLAYQLDPANDETYAEARRLASITKKRDELIDAYERRAQSTAGREARIDALLEACALAQHDFEDTARATGYLSRAVSLAADAGQLLDVIEARVRTLDAEHPSIDGRGMLGALTGVYAQLANEAPRVPALASAWLSRAARIHELKLDDPDAAFRALERASSLSPSDVALLDELTRVAALGKNWEALAKHLQHAADVAIDSTSSSAALSRLGLLCERELASPSRAADAYEQLVRLRPKDADASRRLRHCLRASERYDELLIAIDRELFMLKPEEGKRELLKQAAETWEFGIKNRYEALDAWKKVAALAPSDPDAIAALSRLRLRPRADDSLLDDDVVVSPEDLRPSLIEVSPLSSEERAPVAGLFAEQTAAAEPAMEGFFSGAAHHLAETSIAESPIADGESGAHVAEGGEAAEPLAAANAQLVNDDARTIELDAARLGALPAIHGSEHPEIAASDAAEVADTQSALAHDAVEPAESGEFEAKAEDSSEEDDELDALMAEPSEDELGGALPDDGDDEELADEVTNAAPLGRVEASEAAALSAASEAEEPEADQAQDELEAAPEPHAHEELEGHEELEIDEDALAHSGAIDISDQLQDYDPDVTMPLDREERRQGAAGSLDSLSSLVGRRPTPPPPPPTAARNTGRVPPPPPKGSRPPEDD